ncbi:S41 family peptidase [Muricauda sp. SCSIO 64092]|uniref:S41 family peptidase n=1 Tax=Allomuricauda sp. SCSIO 64092 TaxID=2908842 RepID=UPI001FF45238|nr:S41 family peptidase [Muricauda sp. SCSIO 64092]UOY07574.1 S41 family peptidase [Muricauda sp. SCSIO 64092]
MGNSKIISFFILFTLLLILIGCNSSIQHRKYNLDIEDGKSANGWFSWSGERVLIDNIGHSGNFSIKLASTKRGMSKKVGFGIPANYEGDSIQLKGYIKTKGIKNGASGLYIRTEGSKMGYSKIKIDETESEHSEEGTHDWKKYEVSIPLTDDVEGIFVGGFMNGSGEVWFDDLEVRIDEKDIQTLEEKDKKIALAILDREFDYGSKIEIQNVDNNLIENLDLLGKIWGFLKYHHPKIVKGKYNWDYELFRFLPKYIKAKEKGKRDELLIQWIGGFGRVSKAIGKQDDSRRDVFLEPDHDWMKENDMSPVLLSILNKIYKNRFQGQEKQYYACKPKEGNHIRFTHEDQYFMFENPDDGYRLLALYKYWNIIQYFFPYRHLMDKNWNNVLEENIPIFIEANTRLDYEMALLCLINDINDTHAQLYRDNSLWHRNIGNYYPPFAAKFLDSSLVVTSMVPLNSNKNVKGLFPGDVITHVNEVSVARVIDSLSPYYPASNTTAKLRNISKDILRSKTKTIDISYISKGKTKRKTINLYLKSNLDIERNVVNKSHKILEGDIGYLKLSKVHAGEIDEIKSAFSKTKGAIIDIREYPSGYASKLWTYFVEESTPFAKFTYGNLDNPGEFYFSKTRLVGDGLDNSKETYKGNIIVLVNENTQSMAEFTSMAFRANPKTVIIGSTTAGADGNTSVINLPGGLTTYISGIGVYYPNGGETQRVGIVPDIEVKPTIGGIKIGKDELVKNAIKLIDSLNNVH